MKYSRLISEPIPQSEALTPDQVLNNAGGYVFALDDWKRLERWLILGSDSSTYYQTAKALTRENSQCVQRCYDADYERTIARIVEISDEGRAPKNDAAIFALALGACHKDVKVRQAALAAMPKVCRIGTHLFQFVDCCRALGRGWGRALKRAVANWYETRPINSVAYQAIKYRSREGYSHKRLLQTAHPGWGDGWKASGKLISNPTDDPQRAALYRWICDKEFNYGNLPAQVQAHIDAMSDVSNARRIELIRTERLPWEALPTDCMKDPDIWKAMLPDMGMTALIRNLGGMTENEALKPLSDEVRTVVQRLTDEDQLKKARIHPYNVLMARAVYASGKSVRGSRTWQPIGQITDALEAAFYKAFKFVEPSGKRIMICLDVSGSMSSPLMDPSGEKVGNYRRPIMLPLSVCEGAAAMAMVTMRAEQNWHVMAFADGLRELNFSATTDLNGVLAKTRNVNFGGTDCSLPMIYALEKGLEVDAFQIYTDNETWAGKIHPMKALQDYRRKTGIPAKLVVTGMTSTGFSIADPNDGGAMDVVGFDSNAPAIIADFIKG